MLKCKVCGCEFNATKEKHYICRDKSVYGIRVLAGGDEEDIYDAFDCLQCGCQIIVQQRKRVYVPVNETEEDAEE